MSEDLDVLRVKCWMLSNVGCCGHSPNILLFKLSINVYISFNLISHELRDGENVVRSPQTSVPPACPFPPPDSLLSFPCHPSWPLQPHTLVVHLQPGPLHSPHQQPLAWDEVCVLWWLSSHGLYRWTPSSVPELGPPIGSLLQVHSVSLHHLSLTLFLSCTRVVTFLDKALPSDSENKEWPSPLCHHTSVLGWGLDSCEHSHCGSLVWHLPISQCLTLHRLTQRRGEMTLFNDITFPASVWSRDTMLWRYWPGKLVTGSSLWNHLERFAVERKSPSLERN